MGQQHALQFGRRDLERIDLDELLEAVDDPPVAFKSTKPRSPVRNQPSRSNSSPAASGRPR
jgi:hypothetical protein